MVDLQQPACQSIEAVCPWQFNLQCNKVHWFMVIICAQFIAMLKYMKLVQVVVLWLLTCMTKGPMYLFKGHKTRIALWCYVAQDKCQTCDLPSWILISTYIWNNSNLDTQLSKGHKHPGFQSISYWSALSWLGLFCCQSSTLYRVIFFQCTLA